MCPAIVSGIVTEGALMNCLPIFSLSLATSSRCPCESYLGLVSFAFLEWRMGLNSF